MSFFTRSTNPSWRFLVIAWSLFKRRLISPISPVASLCTCSSRLSATTVRYSTVSTSGTLIAREGRAVRPGGVGGLLPDPVHEGKDLLCLPPGLAGYEVHAAGVSQGDGPRSAEYLAEDAPYGLTVVAAFLEGVVRPQAGNRVGLRLQKCSFGDPTDFEVSVFEPHPGQRLVGQASLGRIQYLGDHLFDAPGGAPEQHVGVGLVLEDIAVPVVGNGPVGYRRCFGSPGKGAWGRRGLWHEDPRIKRSFVESRHELGGGEPHGVGYRPPQKLAEERLPGGGAVTAVAGAAIEVLLSGVRAEGHDVGAGRAITSSVPRWLEEREDCLLVGH